MTDHHGLIAKLRACVDYDPETGTLHWRAKPNPDNDRSIHAWNCKLAGKPAFNQHHAKGYRRGVFSKGTYLAHRVAWAIHYGEWPKYVIDHINGNRIDNRITNLRDVTYRINTIACVPRRVGRSGVCGVQGEGAFWRARMVVNHRNVCLGLFATLDEAAAARRRAEDIYGVTAARAGLPMDAIPEGPSSEDKFSPVLAGGYAAAGDSTASNLVGEDSANRSHAETLPVTHRDLSQHADTCVSNRNEIVVPHAEVQ